MQYLEYSIFCSIQRVLCYLNFKLFFLIFRYQFLFIFEHIHYWFLIFSILVELRVFVEALLCFRFEF